MTKKLLFAEVICNIDILPAVYTVRQSTGEIQPDSTVSLADQTHCGSLVTSPLGCFLAGYARITCLLKGGFWLFACVIRLLSSVAGQLTGVMIACVTGRIAIHISLSPNPRRVTLNSHWQPRRASRRHPAALISQIWNPRRRNGLLLADLCKAAGPIVVCLREGEGLCAAPLHGHCKKSLVLWPCSSLCNRAQQLQSNFSNERFLFSFYVSPSPWGADVLQNCEVMPFVWCEYNLIPVCLILLVLLSFFALNSIKSLISNNFLRLPED